MTPDMKKLYKDFFPSDLEPLIKEKNISKTIIVQAADTVAETEFTLKLAEENEFVAGVVGWVDLESPKTKETIDKLCESKFLKGVRPMIHDIENDEWMLQDNLNENINYLATKNLTFDALVRPQPVKYLIKFVQKFDFLPVVIDHNVFCKFSGILTEVGENYSKTQIEPYVDFILNLFSPNKIMWGSDWPVLTMAENYNNWFDLAMDCCNNFSESEKNMIFANTAKNFYNI